MCNIPWNVLLFIASCLVASESSILGVGEDHPLARFKRQNDGKTEPLVQLGDISGVCGLQSTEAKSLVIGGDNTTRDQYPWMVGIYLAHNKQHICGGAIITPEIILTAAHCFYHSVESTLDPNYYMVAAGKYYREYSDPKDKNAAFSKIKVIKIHDRYRGDDTFFAYDIAIIVVETPFRPSPFIMPVCIDYDTSFDETSLENTTGLVTGWGYTSMGTPSDVLKVLEVNFLTENKCVLPNSFRKYYELVLDKMCLVSTIKGKNACQGDAGGPLIFKHNQQYFIRGILSLGARDETTQGCDFNQPTLFTGVHHHVKLIQQFVTRYSDADGPWNSNFSKSEPKMNIDGCVLPPFKSNGKWEVLVIGQGTSYRPGQSVPKGTVLKYKCNTTQHALYPNHPTAYCDDDGWSIKEQPQCIKTCSSIRITGRMTAKCTLNDLTIDCQTPYHGTQAEVACTSLYEDGEYFKRRFRFCQDGSWKPPLPECEPICGVKSTEATSHVIGGDITKRGEYPWMVGIYLDHNKKHVCGGSIIKPEITLTAAHCFEHSQDPNYYMLAAGKYYREYNNTKDKDAVFSKIKMLKIHDEFRNGENMFAYDIAIVVVETPFKPTRFIMPVCIEYDTWFNEGTLVNTRGLVTGWGYTTSVDTPSDVLKVLEVTFLSETTCPLPEDLRKFYQRARDKMCASSTHKGESSCRGDSGGPLIFKRNERYYVRGIVSLGAKDKSTYGCDSNHVTLFTGVHHHVKFIQQFVTLYSYSLSDN